MEYNFDEIVIHARTGLNPRKNFILGKGNNRYITIKNIKNNSLVIDDNTDFIDDEAVDMIHKRSQIKKGDILFASIGRFGDTYIIEEEPTGWDINESVFAFTVDEKLIRQKYFHYLFKHKETIRQLTKNSSGSTFKSIKMNQLKKMRFDLPDLNSQDIIVSLLDCVTNIISIYEQELLLLDELVKARFVEMFGDPVVNDKKWEIRHFGDLGELKRGKSKHRPRNDPILLGGKYPLIQTGDVTNSNTYIKSYTSTYSEEGLKQSKMWKKGTLCITIAANIAESAILTFDACFPDSVVGFTPNGEVISLFIHYWLSFLQPILEENAPAVAQKNLNVATLEKVGVIVPPLELQNQFALFVQEIDKSRSRIQKSLEASQELFDSLMQEYFG